MQGLVMDDTRFFQPALARWLTLMAMACMCGLVAAQAAVLEVIPLKYRKAEQVIPIIQPMLAPGGSISGLQGQLVVRTTPANMAEVKRILASVDAMPRRLLISVRQDADSDASRRGAELSGSVGGSQARVTVPGSVERGGGNVVLREGDDRLRAHAFDTRNLDSDRTAQTVQVLEGNVAYIRVGQSQPLPSRQVVRTVVNGRVVEQVVDSVEYRDAATGFHVLPRVSGDIVTLEINPQRDTFSAQTPGAVNVQSVATTVSGRLGEWLEIGGMGVESSSRQSTLPGRSSGSVTEARRVLVKVEEVR
jgi:type II secretory pathway component GspD/PulD (secretin)